MALSKKEKNKISHAEHALVNYFLQEPAKYFSFKQLRKKFKRFQKEELYEVVQQLLVEGFLEARGTQFRHPAGAGLRETTAGVKTSDDLIEGIVDMTASGHGYVISPDS